MLDIKVKTINVDPNAVVIVHESTIKRTRSGPAGFVWSIGAPEVVCKVHTLLDGVELVAIGTATNGEKHLLALGLTVWDISLNHRASLWKMVIGRVIDSVVARSIIQWRAPALVAKVVRSVAITLRQKFSDKAQWNYIDAAFITVLF